MYEKLKNQILPQLIPPHSRVLVAISGGPDSVALGHLLWRYANEMEAQNLSLVFTHVHHGVRRESDDEENMVSDLARAWGIPCRIHHFDAKSYAKSTGQSFQTAAREWRYARWKEDMQEEGCTLLATAHHLGDQAETVLYRLLRGSGTAGLGGIYPKKGKIIRPLLSIRKEEILTYCKEESLPFAIDQSNEEPVYVRNKIRLELLPALERDYNPRVQEALGRLSDLLRWDEEYILKAAEELWQRYALENFSDRVGLRRDVFQEPKAILSRLIRKAVGFALGEPRGIGYSYVGQIMESEGQVGWRQNLPGLSVLIDYDAVWFRSSEGIQRQEAFLPSSSVNMGEWVHWKDTKGQEWMQGLFEVEPDDVNHSNSFPNEKKDVIQRVFFDRKELEKIKKSLMWRTRLPGDRMWFQGVGHKSLKKVFQEGKIGASERQNHLLLACGDEILWIPGVKVGDNCQPFSEDRVTALFTRSSGQNE